MQVATSAIAEFYNELKFWLPAIGFSWAVFKAYTWIRSIKTNDLHHLQLGIEELNQKIDKQTEVLKTEINSQTTSLVGELRELRADFRQGYGKRLTN